MSLSEYDYLLENRVTSSIAYGAGLDFSITPKHELMVGVARDAIFFDATKQDLDDHLDLRADFSEHAIVVKLGYSYCF